MATLYVAEYTTIGGTGNFPVGGAFAPPITEQVVTIGGGTLQSAAFNTNTSFVRLHADSICSIAFGDNPTATTSKMRMAAGQTEYFAVKPGQKVAVISNT